MVYTEPVRPIGTQGKLKELCVTVASNQREVTSQKRAHHRGAPQKLTDIPPMITSSLKEG